MHSKLSLAAAALLIGGTASANPVPLKPQQGGAVPGLSQASRFSSEFNPAISFVVDAIADYVEHDDPDEEGAALEVRSFELAGAAWIDPRAWVGL